MVSRYETEVEEGGDPVRGSFPCPLDEFVTMPALARSGLVAGVGEGIHYLCICDCVEGVLWEGSGVIVEGLRDCWGGNIKETAAEGGGHRCSVVGEPYFRGKSRDGAEPAAVSPLCGMPEGGGGGALEQLVRPSALGVANGCFEGNVSIFTLSF